MTMGKYLDGFFARRMHRGADARDLAQETMVRTLAKWGQVCEPAARRAWTFSIAHNPLRNQYRSAAREPLPLEQG